MMRVEIRNLKRLGRVLEHDQRRIRYSFETAVRVEGFQRMKALRRDLARGRSGNTVFEPLSIIGRYWTKGQRGRGNSPRRKPMAAMVRAITYDASGGTRGGGRFQFSFGVTHRSGSAWRRIAAFQQSGGIVDVSDKLRRDLAYKGGTLSSRSRNRKYFFLHKSTMRFNVPPRDFIGPYWRDNEDDTWRSIRRNFRRKLRGERI